MALLFNAATQWVNHGKPASLNNIATGTVLVWAYPTSIISGAAPFVKQDDVTWTGNGPTMFTTTTGIDFGVSRSVQGMELRTAGSEVTANQWNFLGATWYLAGADADQKLYFGSLSTLAAEPASYNRRWVGSGTQFNDSGYDFIVANSPNNTGQAFPGRIAWIGIWTRQLTLGEIRSQQFRPHPTAGCVFFVHFGFNGTGTQADWSGQKNNGTVTSTPTVSAHVPLAVVPELVYRTPYRISTTTISAAGGIASGEAFAGIGGIRSTEAFGLATVTDSGPSPNANVAAVAASATAAGIAPTLKGDAQVLSVLATGVSDAIAPSISGSSNVSAVAGTASANIANPIPSADGSLIAIVGTSAGDLPAPVVSGNASITASAASAAASVIAPSINVGGSVTVQAAVAQAIAQALAPSASADAWTQAVVAAATSALPAPSVNVDVQVQATAAMATSALVAPSASADARVQAATATAVSAMLAPSIGVAAGVNAAVAVAMAQMLAPSLAADASIQAAIASAISTMPSPLINVTVPVITGIGEAIEVSARRVSIASPRDTTEVSPSGRLEASKRESIETGKRKSTGV